MYVYNLASSQSDSESSAPNRTIFLEIIILDTFLCSGFKLYRYRVKIHATSNSFRENKDMKQFLFEGSLAKFHARYQCKVRFNSESITARKNAFAQHQMCGQGMSKATFDSNHR